MRDHDIRPFPQGKLVMVWEVWAFLGFSLNGGAKDRCGLTEVWRQHRDWEQLRCLTEGLGPQEIFQSLPGLLPLFPSSILVFQTARNNFLPKFR